jgi:hypothetical protein
MEIGNFGIYGVYLIAVAALVLGIVALVLTTRKQERGPRGRPGKSVTGATGASFGFSILESDPVIISGAQMLTMGSDPIPIFAVDPTSSYVILGMILSDFSNPAGPVVDFAEDLVIIDNPDVLIAPKHTIVTFPNSRPVLIQIRPTSTTFGALQLYPYPLPGSIFFYLTTADFSNPTGTGVGATMTVRLLYTKTPF